MKKYIDKEKLVNEINSRLAFYLGTAYSVKDTNIVDGLDEALEIIESLPQEQPKKRLIQVKCLYPYDESWQKNKVYTCKVWHHGDLNRDFWDVYYDYEKDPRYVQFPSIELLNEEFVVIQEQQEVDLDALVDEAFDKYSSVDGYGQLSASFNRAELYSFIKKIARKEE